jgi:hypothetical protein
MGSTSTFCAISIIGHPSAGAKGLHQLLLFGVQGTQACRTPYMHMMQNIHQVTLPQHGHPFGICQLNVTFGIQGTQACRAPYMHMMQNIHQVTLPQHGHPFGICQLCVTYGIQGTQACRAPYTNALAMD